MAHLSKYSYSILYASVKACALPRTVWIRRISTSSTHRSISEQAEGERMLSLCFAVPNEDTNLTAVDLSSSIYAPLLGATPSSRPTPMARSDFNPRTPCGVRQQNCRNIHGKFAKKLQNFCKAKQRAALPRVGQRESGRYFRPCAVRTSQQDSERFRFASDNERALRSVTRLCAEVLDAGFILVSKVIKA